MAWRDAEGSAVEPTHFSQAKKEFQGSHGGSWLQSQLFRPEAGGWRFKACLDYIASSALPFTDPLKTTTNPQHSAPRAEPTQTLQQQNLPPAQPNIYLDSVFQGWSQMTYSPVTTCSKKIVIYADTNFYYLVKIKFCKITSFSVSFG